MLMTTIQGVSHQLAKRTASMNRGIRCLPKGCSDFLVLSPVFGDREYLCSKDQFINAVLKVVFPILDLAGCLKDLIPTQTVVDAALRRGHNANSLAPVASNQSRPSQFSMRSHKSNFRKALGISGNNSDS